MHPGPAQTLAAALQTFRRRIKCQDAALILHHCRHNQGLATSPRTHIGNLHPRPRITEQAGQLRPFILNFKQPLFPVLQIIKAGAFLQTHTKW